MHDDRNEGAQANPTPRWVKVFGIITLLVVVLAVVVIVAGRGGHSPRRHGSPDETTPTARTVGHTGPPTGVTHAQPWR